MDVSLWGFRTLTVLDSSRNVLVRLTAKCIKRSMSGIFVIPSCTHRQTYRHSDILIWPRFFILSHIRHTACNEHSDIPDMNLQLETFQKWITPSYDQSQPLLIHKRSVQSKNRTNRLTEMNKTEMMHSPRQANARRKSKGMFANAAPQWRTCTELPKIGLYGLYLVARNWRNVFLLLLTCSAWRSLGPA